MESWEENWLFQKKKIPIQSEPVVMLVPNPSSDYRALIGDKDAEDTSDLSEFSTLSDDEVEEDLIEAINRVVPKSPDTKENILDIQINEEQKLFEFSNLNDENPKIEITDNTEIEEIEEKIFIDQENLKHEPDKIDKINLIYSEDNEFKNINDELPKTPTPSPIRNSLCENDLKPISCNLEKLNEKLVSIDRNSDEEKLKINLENNLDNQIIDEYNGFHDEKSIKIIQSTDNPIDNNDRYACKNIYIFFCYLIDYFHQDFYNLCTRVFYDLFILKTN